MTDRLELLERYGRVYGELGLAIAFTRGTEGDNAKRLGTGWPQTKPLPDGGFGAGLLAERGARRNPAVVLRPSGLIGLEVDGNEAVARVMALELPTTVTVQSSAPDRLHFWFRPWNGTTPAFVSFRFEPAGITAEENRGLLVPPSIHPGKPELGIPPGRVYCFLASPEDTEIAVLPEEKYEELVRLAEVARGENGRAPAIGEAIPIGTIDNTLTSLAGSMRRRGMSEDAIYAALVVELERCEPGHTHTEDDCRRIAQSVARYKPAEGTTPTASALRSGSESVADFSPPAGPGSANRFGASTFKEEAPNRGGWEPEASVAEQTASAESVAESVPRIRVEELHAFAAVTEPGAEPLLGDDDVCVLALDGTMTTYGTGGTAKTTASVDRALHYAAGDPWLGLAVPSARRVLILENEGPRGRFRKKLEAKIAAWDGSPIEEGRVHVVSEPWGMLRFDDTRVRAELTECIDELGIEVVVAGPIKRLGLQGGGTPAEVTAFLLLLDSVKEELGRSLAYDLTHHTNKAGAVSGDWEGTGDTLVRMDRRGHGATALTWEKVRWGSALQGVAWKLVWRDGERFEIDETPERTEEDIAAELIAYVRANPGTTWTPCQKALGGTATANQEIRDGLLAQGELVDLNAGTNRQSMRLYLPDQVPEPEQTTLDEEPA